MTLANILTITRLILLPILIVCLVLGGFKLTMAALLLYIIGALTDFADGYIARKYNQITPFGTFLDPIADKVYVAAILFVLVANHIISGLWIILPILIISREILISGLREYLGPHNVQFPVTKLAKWKTTTQLLAVGTLIPAGYIPYTYEAGLTLLTICTLLTVITGWQYMKVGMQKMKKL